MWHKVVGQSKILWQLLIEISIGMAFYLSFGLHKCTQSGMSQKVSTCVGLVPFLPHVFCNNKEQWMWFFNVVLLNNISFWLRCLLYIITSNVTNSKLILLVSEVSCVLKLVGWYLTVTIGQTICSCIYTNVHRNNIGCIFYYIVNTIDVDFFNNVFYYPKYSQLFLWEIHSSL